MSDKPININSEIGKLKTVILHRPGKELEGLTPEYLEKLLFDDIPYLPDAIKEHDEFADALRANGVEVLQMSVWAFTCRTIKLRQQMYQSRGENAMGIILTM